MISQRTVLTSTNNPFIMKLVIGVKYPGRKERG
jgi:hypothetical protein